MKRLDRFILKSFIGPFIAILLVVIFILMMQFLWLYIDELVGKGLSLKIILEFMMWGGCTILPLAMPLATLLASMMTMGSMGENNELIAIKSTGVSLARVMLPLVMASAVISVGAFYAGNTLLPKAYNEIYTLRDDISRTKDEIRIPDGTFYEGIEGYILRVDSTDTRSGMMHGVMVYDHKGNKGNTAVTLCDSALMQMSPDKDYLVFTMYNGSNFQEDNTMRYRDTTLELQSLAFRRQQLFIPLKNYKFEKSDTARYGDQVKCLGLEQLNHDRDSIRTLLNEAKDRQYLAMCKQNSFVEFSQLDTSVAVQPVELFDYELLGKWDSKSKEGEAYRLASQLAEKAANDMMSYYHETYTHTFFLRHADLEALSKFAVALACFILFFIGAPLGALIRKGGLGTSAIISVLFFVLYWVVNISGSKLAKDGAVDAVTGAFVSAYVLAPIGFFLSWRAINDRQLFNTDSFKVRWNRLLSRIVRFFRPVRVVFMGTPEFAVASLDAVVKSGVKVVGVVTVADKPSGRGLKMNESAVKQYAVAHGIPVLQPLKLKDPEFLDALRAWKADLFVVVAFRMLPEEVWKMPRLGTFNLHAALLPQYRGAAPLNWAVINGERISGVTTFMIDKNIDTGGIIFRQECRIGPDDTVGDLHDRLMGMGADLVVQTIEAIVQHNAELRVQRSFVQGSEVLHAAPKLSRELSHIDWSGSTAEVYNLIRGLSPYPTAYTNLLSEGSDEALQLKIYGARRRDDLHGTPGQLLSDGKNYLAIATRDGAVELTDVQASGKKRMEVKAFLAGFRNPGQYRADEGSSSAEVARARAI